MPVKTNAKITTIIQETPRVKAFRLSPETPFSFIPGQFVQLSIEGLNNLNGTPLKRSYSIASKPTDPYIELCIAKMDNGLMSERLHAMNGGETVVIEGPYGNFRLKDNDRDIVMIAGGSGISPIMAMLRSLFENNTGQKIQFFFGVRNPQEIIYKEELLKMSDDNINFELIVGYSQNSQIGPNNLQGYIHEIVRRNNLSPENKDVYICGPPIMVNAVKETLAQMNFSKEQIQVDQW